MQEHAPQRGLLRFITCGSVDDGKSTLIGRLLYDAKLVNDDQLATLAYDSERYGTVGNELDFALLVDGLEAERQQGITIDVAYRFFSTSRRSFIVADTPGHEQYTRNMATGASKADVAVLVIDARRGLLVQTKRHSLICSILGVKHIIVALNKMDQVGFQKEAFETIANDYAKFSARLGFTSVETIPISARFGDNVAMRSPNMLWYERPTLLAYLETLALRQNASDKPFRFPVQWVNHPNPEFRGYAGTVVSGTISVGEPIVIALSGQASHVAKIVTYDGDLTTAEAGDAITLTLADPLDVGRGDTLAKPNARPQVGDQFAAHVIWVGEDPLLPGRSYLARIGTQTTSIVVTAIKHRLDINNQEHLAAATLRMNEIGECNLATGNPIAFDAYSENRSTGSLIFIDRFTNNTVGAGTILFGLRRANNIHRQSLLVGKCERAALKNQTSAIIWFTGLSGAGKSTIANLVEKQLHAAGYHTTLLDGDNIRRGLNRDLGFTEADRVENIRRVGEVAKLMVESGLIVLCSFISPYRAEREAVRQLVEPGEFIEVFVDAPLEICVGRDPKGLYAKAYAGQLKNFTGVDAPYEVPSKPDVHLQTAVHSPDQLARRVLNALAERSVVVCDSPASEKQKR
jgi:bifunctional enzyme CysN/CysC